MEARRRSNSFKVGRLPRQALIYDNAVWVASSHHKNLGKIVFAKISNDEGNVYYPVKFDDTIKDDNLVLMSAIMRDNLHAKENEFISIELINADPLPIIDSDHVSLTIRRLDNNKNGLVHIKRRFLTVLFQSQFSDYPLCVGQDLVIPYGDAIAVVSVDALKSSQFAAFYQLNANTSFEIDVSPFSGISINKENHSNESEFKQPLTPLKPAGFDFNVKGVGGHKKELEKILLQGFYSRIMPPELAKAYGVEHTKGVLLYGPPGTGKTSIAKAIANMFPKTHVKVINGPELKSKYVGESPENVRNIFLDAQMEWEEKGIQSDLHVFIFEEIDAQAPPRGETTGTHAEDDMTTQMLTILDGVNSPGNILIIATTNRKDRVDPALLRPGRLGVHIEIGLPDEAGRYDILFIKTEAMRNEKIIDSRVDLNFWAKETKNFTGAELTQLVQNAVYYAMEGNLETEVGKSSVAIKKDIKTKEQLAKVKAEHFQRGFQEIIPSFGVDKSCREFTKQFVIYNDEIKTIVDRFLALLVKVEKNKNLNGFRLLISGESGVGKTTLAYYLANLSGVNYVRTITVDKLLSMPVNKQLSFLDEELENLQRVPFSIIILDDLESLISADASFSSYSNLLRMKFEAFLKKIALSENKCIVLATTSNSDFIKHMHLRDLFNEHDVLAPVTINDIASDETFKLFSELCDVHGYKVLPAVKSSLSGEIELPIRELIYQIKKFCSDEVNAMALDINDFCHALVDNPQAKSDGLKIKLH